MLKINKESECLNEDTVKESEESNSIICELIGLNDCIETATKVEDAENAASEILVKK